MIIIEPTTINDSRLLSSTITENDYPEWRRLEFVPQSSGITATYAMCAAPNGDIYTAVYGGDIYKKAAGSSTFTALGQTSRSWIGLCAAPNGNIYACVAGGDIYMQTSGSGNFNALSQTSRLWRCLCAAPNGNIYACVAGGDIYMQTSGSGNFNALSQTSRNWYGICADLSGNIYATVSGGDIYVQALGTGDFTALGQTSRAWRGICVVPNGDVFAVVFDGDIYRRIGGNGNFIAMGHSSKYWLQISSATNGDIYAAVYGATAGDDIYKQSTCPGVFTALNQSSLSWGKMCSGSNNDVYAVEIGGDVYKRTGGTGDFSALGQTDRNWSGICETPGGDIYATVLGGDIYKMAFGESTLTALGVGNKDWSDICSDSAGNRYACVYGGDIYKAEAGTDVFTAMNQTTRYWKAICADSNDDIWCAVILGDVYKMAGGVGLFCPMGFTSRAWMAICSTPTRDIYFCVQLGYVYRLKNGESELEQVTDGTASNEGICSDSSGNVYLSVDSDDIYILTANTGPFYSIGDRCMVTAYGVHKNYQALVANYNAYPPVNYDPDDIANSTWLELTATNKWLPFDKKCGSKASKQTSLNYLLLPGSIDSLALISLESTSVDIKLTDPSHVGADAKSGTVTQANMKISAVDGTAFVDFGVADVLTQGVSENAYIEIYDNAGKKITGYIKAAGTGETYGTEKVTNGTFDSDTTGWSSSTGVLTSVAGGQSGNCLQITENGTINPYCTQTITLSQYKLFKWISGYVKAGTSSSYRMYITNTYEFGWTSTQAATGSWVNKANGMYFTSPFSGSSAAMVLRNICNVGSGQTMLFDEQSIKQVLTPSVTGVTITSTPGGSTYNWASKDADFNYNDASGYTYKISVLYNETITTGESKTDVVKLDLPGGHASAKLSLTINNSAGIAKIGEIVVGNKTDIGSVKSSPSIGIQSFSTKKVDDYGDYDILKRGYSRKLSCGVRVAKADIDSTDKLLAKYIDTAAVFVGSEDLECMVAYGYCKDFNIVVPYATYADCAIEIEGLKKN